jgi:DNA-binding Xre family transcriptional regulator
MCYGNICEELTIVRISYLGLRNIILMKFVDTNEFIYYCQLPKAALHDINTSSSTHPIYLERICEYLHCKMEDIFSQFV